MSSAPASREFAKIADNLKERYVDAITVCIGQEAMINEANKILEELKINENDPNWLVAKRIKCALCSIKFDCSTVNSPDPDECLLVSGEKKTTTEASK